MGFPDWIDLLWGELRFKELVGLQIGEGYQRLFHQVMKAVDGDDFLDVRPTGKYGDYKCDGWEMHSATCYAVYGPFTRKTPDQVRRKIENDLRGAIQAWPEMRNWRFVHNDYTGLSALVVDALVTLRKAIDASASHVTILPPWGPKDLWWLLRQAPAEARASVVGIQARRLNPDLLDDFVGVDDDPVSVSAGRSVAQLLDGFAAGGVVDPLAATTFGGALTMFLLGDETTFNRQATLLEQYCHDDPFEAMIASIVFCVQAVKLWEAVTGEESELWAEAMVACGSTVPYITGIVMSALHGITAKESPSGHPEDQLKVTMNLGQVTAMTLRLAADHRPEPLVSILQDLLIAVQRVPPASWDTASEV